LLTTLADKSLVVVETRDHTTRYRLLETVRQYAREKLIAPAQTQDRHCDYFVDWIEQAAPHLRRADALEWRDRIEWEYDNLRAAFEYAIDRDAPIALRIAWGLHLFWKRYGFVSEGRAWLERLLPQLEARAPIAPRARAWNLAGYLAYIQMDIPNAIRMSEQALALAQSAEEEWEIGFALQRLGWASGFVRRPNAPRRSVVDCHTQSLEIFQRLGDEEMITESMFGLAHALGTHNELERGVALFQQAIARQRAAGNHEGESETLAWLSLSYTLAKDYDSAEPYAQQALALARTLRTKNALGTALIVLGRCVLRKDEPRRAMPYSVEAVRLFNEKGDVSTTVMVLEEVALCVGLLGKPAPAARIFGAIQFQWETKRATSLLRIGIYDRQWGEIRARLGDAAFDQARAEGRVLSLDQIVDLALETARKMEIER
jgi:non-specific serine/threonine protein kinase